MNEIETGNGLVTPMTTVKVEWDDRERRWYVTATDPNYHYGRIPIMQTWHLTTASAESEVFVWLTRIARAVEQARNAPSPAYRPTRREPQ